MNFPIEVNNKIIIARKGETILEALTRNGLKVPTLCYMPDLNPSGSCRMCVVEVEGKSNLITACSHPVEEWMKIKTHSPRVVNARKTNVELLLSNHPDDCLYCERNGKCELQRFAEDLNIRERRFPGKKNKQKTDPSGLSIVRDPAKCILCGRCVRTCDEVIGSATLGYIGRGNSSIIGPSFNRQLNLSSCLACGQCIMSCPTGALHEKRHSSDLQNALHNADKHVVIQYSPTISVSISEDFGAKAGKDLYGVINAGLRKTGFDKVFDASFSADLYIIELAAEFEKRLLNGGTLPLFSSDCPAWVKFLEQKYPEYIPHLSLCKSPQQMFGAVINNYYTKMFHIKPDDLYTVSAMPCTARKFEAKREQMTQKGISDVDAVLTTRELVQFIRLNGVDTHQLEPEMADFPFHVQSSAGKLTGVTGGLTESLIRTLFYRMTGKEPVQPKINDLRNIKDYKEYHVKIGDFKLGFAIVNTVKYASKIIEEIKAGRDDIQFIEVMACPFGCVNGGGQPITGDVNAVKTRIKAIYENDDKDPIRFAHKNPAIVDLYREFLGEPGGTMSETYLHTTYAKRDVPL
ncbi:MAG: [Fe-Fe] hydrogenase large subunit C-terminal domain-containing protein [Omnitrophica WOR_2 bacterium]|jgi:NADH-quinone oxidoreductase subunit G/NADP-reducing hydrogenase subunit HndD